MTAPLDPRTLRAVSRRLRMRGRELDRKNKNLLLVGAKRSHVRVGRACECDMQADHLLTEARAIEKRRAKKAGKRS